MSFLFLIFFFVISFSYLTRSLKCKSSFSCLYLYALSQCFFILSLSLSTCSLVYLMTCSRRVIRTPVDRRCKVEGTVKTTLKFDFEINHIDTKKKKKKKVHPPDADRNSHKKRRPNINKRENEAEMMVSTSFAPCTTKGNSRQTLDFLTGTRTHWGRTQLRDPKEKTDAKWRAADNSRNPD
jgi:hypothetical protein